MPRTYAVTFEGVAVSAAQDLFQIVGATAKSVKIRRVRVNSTDTTAPTSQMLEWRMRYLPATVTSGSGGTTPTPQKTDPGDAAATFTALANNTTKATTSGTAVIFYEGADHVFNGLDETFDGVIMKPPPLVGAGPSIVIELLSTVTGTVHLSGTAEVEEEG